MAGIEVKDKNKRLDESIYGVNAESEDEDKKIKREDMIQHTLK